MQQEEQEYEDDEEMDDEEDGHMESSRELSSSGPSSPLHYFPPPRPRPVKRSTVFATVTKIPSRIVAAITAPFTSSPKVDLFVEKSLRKFVSVLLLILFCISLHFYFIFIFSIFYFHY